MTPDKLEHYLTTWNLSDSQPLAQTVTSHLYTVKSGQDRAVLKLLLPYGLEDESRGGIALAYWNGHGAVRLLNRSADAQLLEYADGEDLVALVRRGEDEQATAIIADVLHQLHTSPPPFPEGLVPLRRWFRSLFRKADEDRQAGNSSVYVRAADLAENLLAAPRDVVVLHGDIHHENIRYRDGRGWLAFDPKGLVGERTYDTANTLCNPYAVKEIVHIEARLLRNAAILADRTNIDLSRLLAFLFVYSALSACWFIEGKQDPDYMLRIAAIVEPHLR